MNPLKRMTGWAKVGGGALAMLTGSAASALATQPEGWEINLQPAATEVMRDIHSFSNLTMWIVVPIVAFVMLLLLICIVRFNARANPVPSRTTHNTMIEVAWTVLPILILVVIAIPSFRLLYKELVVPEADMTIKATGFQWAWSYEYTDDAYEGISFDAYMMSDDARAEKISAGASEADYPRLLAADYDVIVPVDKIVRVQVTSTDVIHSFAMPSFGVKVDAIPGRLNETWFKAEQTGVYYGQCSELCGKDHAFMPIAIRVVSQDQFDAWAEAAKTDVDQANELLAGMIDHDKNVADNAPKALTVAGR